MSAGPAKLAYLGLGTMGLAMARRLVDSSSPLAVFDVRPEPVATLAAAGAVGTNSVAEAGRVADIAFINVLNDQQVADVVEGSERAPGLLSAMSPGSVIVIQSTIHPDTCRRLARLAAESGVQVIDAPFTGGAAAAARGSLGLFVGGGVADVQTCEPFLSRMGTINHIGPVGSGLAAKLANNLVIAIMVAAVHESLSLAEAEGIDERTMLRLLTAGAADNWVARNWDGIATMSQSYPGGVVGLTNLTYKDVNLALSVAHDHEVALPTTALSGQCLAEAYRRIAKSGLFKEQARESA